jgi:hypothetical protein
MKKLLIYLLRLTNPTPQEISSQMMLSILSTSDHKKQIESFNIFEDDFTRYLANCRKDYLDKASVINSFIPNASTISKMDVVFNEPLRVNL